VVCLQGNVSYVLSVVANMRIGGMDKVNSTCHKSTACSKNQ